MGSPPVFFKLKTKPANAFFSVQNPATAVVAAVAAVAVVAVATKLLRVQYQG